MDGSFEQEVFLPDEHRIRLRFIRTSDEQLLRDGFARLSPASRYARFHTSLKELPTETVHALTHVDGVDHCAIVAVDSPDAIHPSSERGVGVARFVRTREDLRCAELAVTVADELQGLGLASHLIAKLAEAAHERGIHTFIGYVLSENRKARRLLHKLGAEWVASERGLATYRLPIAHLLPQNRAAAA